MEWEMNGIDRSADGPAEALSQFHPHMLSLEMSILR